MKMYTSFRSATFPVFAHAGPGFVHRAALAALLVAIAWIAVPAFAQGSFPNRPVKLVLDVRVVAGYDADLSGSATRSASGDAAAAPN